MSDSGSTIQFFALQGVTCAGCVRSVKRTVSTLQVAGKIEDFSVNFADRTLVVSGDCPSDEISIALSEAGYGATLLRGEDDREELEQTELAHYRRTLTTSVLALMSGALMMAAMMLGWQPPLDTEAGALGSALQALVSGAVMFFCAGHIYRGAWKSLKTRNFNMDTLIAMGTLSAWGYSAVIAVLSYLAVEELPSSAQHLYFEAAVMILGFILLGQAIEIKVRGTTAKAVQSLVASQPGTAWRQCEDGQVRAVDIALVVPGDTLLAKPGETIACDGEIIEGRSGVDESLLTGESIAQLKGPGDTIVGGTLNGAAPLHYRVTQVGGNTLMAKMVREVRRAQNSKPPLGVLADSIAAVFVPAVLLITSLTLVLWWWFGPAGYWGYTMMASVSVLIIACPCALGLATPISTMVGVGLAAKRGILIRKGDALQVASKVTTLVLDKTGTLTQGKPSVTDVQWLDECCQNDVLQALQALERPSEHPLARAVLAYTEQHLPGALERQ
ncbi:MAG: heavy metal translocating P-type ATPase, partial [Pseudomonadales bacterium]